ncbi:hypothetical protein F5Y18DRAFT_433128 [Xylariaceae sp. FL1019]|nr:hypothetical protein F5Y18DRAFT_433128 [Xylariaceae sp. FL1019]
MLLDFCNRVIVHDILRYTRLGQLNKLTKNMSSVSEKSEKKRVKLPTGLSSTISSHARAPKRTRRRLAGKRKVKSCGACRAAHLRCVADCYGVPCERCAKKGLTDCTLMQTPAISSTKSFQSESNKHKNSDSTPEPQEPVIIDIEPSQAETHDDSDSADTVDLIVEKGHYLKQMAADVIAYMSKKNI